MKRTLFLVYAAISYLVFFGTFLYAIGFVGGYVVPKDIDDGPETPSGVAVAINLALLGLFGVQHSIMARPAFKRMWMKLVPQPIERATYGYASSACLILLYWAWRPMPGVVWDLTDTPGEWAMSGLFFFGWALVLASSFMIDHFDLFGLRQAWLYFQGKEYTHHPFRTPFLYKYVRHPLYLGWFFAFWPTPVMTQGHLLFSIVTTTYIVLATLVEERDLVTHLGEAYIRYRKTTPRYFPFTKRRSDAQRSDGAR
jgi:protein-S-isoprenylcysteine O-methyltransferase Ste14